MIAFLHGLLGGPSSFDALIEGLPSGTAVHRPWLPGHGGRRAPESGFDATIDALAQELADVAEEPVDLVGYSLGARVALGLFARHPRRFRRAVLVSVHPGLASDRARRERQAEDERWARLAEQGLSVFVDAWERRPLFASQARLAPMQLARQRTLRLAHDPHGIAAALRHLGLGAMPCYADALDALHDRVTVVCGERDDKFVTLARARRAPVKLIPDVGHNPCIEAPHALAALVARVLKEASP